MFRVELSTAERPTREWLTRLLYRVVADGGRYNAGNDHGTYRVVPADLDEETFVTAPDDTERTETLADAVETYAEFDPATTELRVTITSVATDPPMAYALSVLPRAEGRWTVSFEGRASELEDPDRFRSFLPLPLSVFERFDFSHGVSRAEHQERVPATPDAMLSADARIVTCYSASLTERAGRDRLLSAPTLETLELDDGSVVLIACADPVGCPPELRALNDHLSA